MKKTMKIFALLILPLILIIFPSSAYSVSYPILEHPPETDAETVLRVGDIVCLFESGTGDVRNAIHIHDLLQVYRDGPDHQLLNVGKIKVLSFKGENYFKGEVVSGDLRPGDIAKKDDVASLVISSEDKCQ